MNIRSYHKQYLSTLEPLDREKEILELRLEEIKALTMDSLLEKEGGLAWMQRKERREIERFYGQITFPGPWDEDLDMYHELRDYPIELPDTLKAKGYVASSHRDVNTWTWNGYIKLPENHPILTLLHTKGLDYWDVYRPSDLPSPPIKTNYCHNGEFGWVHSQCSPLKPNGQREIIENYVDFNGVSKKCLEMALYFESLETYKVILTTCNQCGTCAGCLWDKSEDCAEESGCKCRKCKPQRPRRSLGPGKTECMWCYDPIDCNCYGCQWCPKHVQEIQQSVTSLIQFITSTHNPPPAPTLASVPISNDEDGWIVYKSKKSRRRKAN